MAVNKISRDEKITINNLRSDGLYYGASREIDYNYYDGISQEEE